VEIGVANTSVQSEITIPIVRGETGPQASQEFFSLGFQAVYVTNITQPGAKAGTVLEQMPAAGSRGKLDDTTIHLTIAASGPGSVRFIPHPKG
jgi:beta-lactam-binding protein with PASTA domain